MKRSGARQASVRSPISLPQTGSASASAPCDPARADGWPEARPARPRRQGLRSRTWRSWRSRAGRRPRAPRGTRRPTGACAFERRKVGVSCGSLPSGANHSACSRPKLAPNTAFLRLQPIVDRRGAQRPGGRQLLVRKDDREAAPVVLLHLGVGVGRASRSRRSVRRPSRRRPCPDRPRRSTGRASGRRRRPARSRP